jgi:hypothetical protein
VIHRRRNRFLRKNRIIRDTKHIYAFELEQYACRPAVPQLGIRGIRFFREMAGSCLLRTATTQGILIKGTSFGIMLCCIGRRVRACTRLSEAAKALTTRDHMRGIVDYVRGQWTIHSSQHIWLMQSNSPLPLDPTFRTGVACSLQVCLLLPC